MKSTRYSKIEILPIKVLLFFLMLSEVLYFIGPIDFRVHSNLLLFIYLCVLNYSLFCGYRSGLKRCMGAPAPKKRQFRNNTITLLIYAALIITLFRFFRSTHVSSISHFISLLTFSFENSGTVYSAKLESAHTNLWTYIFMMLAPIVFLGQTLGVYHWKTIKLPPKICLVICFIVEMSYWIVNGTRKGMFDIILLVFGMVIAAHPNMLSDERNRRKIVWWIVLAIIMFIYFFVISNLSRHGYTASEYGEYDISSIKLFYQEHLPVWLNVSLVNICGYLCQGYRALSLCLNDFFTDGIFRFTFGGGSSWFNVNVIENLFGYNIIPDTYQGYLYTQYGISPMVNWHTLYLWLANDLTFFGVPIAVYLLGYLFSVSWVDALNHSNKYAAPMSVLCIMIVAYAFANNQVLSFSFITFIYVFFMYLANSGRIKI